MRSGDFLWNYFGYRGTTERITPFTTLEKRRRIRSDPVKVKGPESGKPGNFQKRSLVYSYGHS